MSCRPPLQLKFNYFLDDQDLPLSQTILEFSSFALPFSPSNLRISHDFPENHEKLTKSLYELFFSQENTHNSHENKPYPFARSYSKRPFNMSAVSKPRNLFETLRKMRKMAIIKWFWAIDYLRKQEELQSFPVISLKKP